MDQTSRLRPAWRSKTTTARWRPFPADKTRRKTRRWRHNEEEQQRFGISSVFGGQSLVFWKQLMNEIDTSCEQDKDLPRLELFTLAQNPYWRGRICTTDLLVVIISDQILFVLKRVSFLLKETNINYEEVNQTELFPSVMFPWINAGNPNWRGWLSTIDLLVLTSWDKLLLILKRLLTFLPNKLP